MDENRFSRAVFESLDPEAGSSEAVRVQLQELVLQRLLEEGADGVRALVASLNGMGHELVPAPASHEGYISYVGHTNGGTRALWIHVEEDLPGVMVLYHETLEAVVARRKASLTAKERKRTGLQDAFYERGLELVRAEADYSALMPGDRCVLCLYQLETGVANGGFATWLANTDSTLVGDALRYLAEVGATDLHQVVSDLATLLPPGSSPTLSELEERAAELSALDDRFLGSPDDLAVLVMSHQGRT